MILLVFKCFIFIKYNKIFINTYFINTTLISNSLNYL